MAATAPALASSSSPSTLAQPLTERANLANPLLVSLGFLGIQFAWSLQMGQMSPLLERLGSAVWLTSLIWAAGPVTGVLVQPIVGTLSDRHRSALGRRRPFLMMGTLLVALCLVLMPNSAALGEGLTLLFGVAESFPMGLLVAALLLWVLDASINLTQGPYRALVPDVFAPKAQTKAYAMMSLTIGLGSIASFLISFWLDDLHILFYLGAVAIVAAMAVTIATTKEPSSLEVVHPEVIRPSADAKAAKGVVAGFLGGVKLTANQWTLCLAHSCTWFGLMCLYIFFALFVPKMAFGAVEPGSAAYTQGVQWASLGLAVLNGTCFAFSPFIDRLCCRFGNKTVHSVAQTLMAIGLVGLFLFHTPTLILVWMALVGIGWATTLSVPFAMLAHQVPKGKEGVLMGVFNIFVAAPGLLCSLLVGPLLTYFNLHVGYAFLLGGVAMLASVLLLQRFQEETRVIESMAA